MTEDSSPVVAALRMSRKGRLNYDRYWDRSGSVERVIREVTSDMESVTLYSPPCGVVQDQEGAGQGDCLDATVKLSTKKRNSKQIRQKKPPGKIDKDESENIADSSSPPAPLRDYGSPTPVTIAINRDCERDIRDSRNIVMSRDSDSTAVTDLSRSVLSERDINTTLDQSINSTSSQDVFDSSIFIYTPDIVKSVARRSPRVDLVKLRLPDSLLVGRAKTEDTELDEDEVEVSEEVPCLIPPPRSEEGPCIVSPSRTEVASRLISPLSPVEDELARYQMQAKVEAGKRLHERKMKWEEESKRRENEAREQLELERRSWEEEVRKEKEIDVEEVERRVEERLAAQQREREDRQKELIMQARREEQLAREAKELKKRVKEQTDRLEPVHSRIMGRVQKVLGVWSGQEDKGVFSSQVQGQVTSLVGEWNNLLKEARTRVLEGQADSAGIWEKLDKFEAKSSKLEVMLGADLTKHKELVEAAARKVEEDKKAAEEKKIMEDKKAAEAAAAASKEKELAAATTAQPASQQPPAPSPASAVTPTPAAVPAGLADSISPENQAWYQSIIQFKTDFVKDVTFSETEKPYKFSLQKAVNTPINSLSGVSSSHLNDKVDKLVGLLSGQPVTLGDKQISITTHPHARSFCMALAAKKLAKQGEDVVSSDNKAAFPAATLALAVWDKFPEFGKLLLAYLFESCPFLVPFHPPRAEGQSDKDFYLALGYRYEGEVPEKQDKYLKRMGGLARLYAALSVSCVPQTAQSHPHPPVRVWSWLTSVCNLSPHMDITASLLLDILEVAGSQLLAKYGPQFLKLLRLLQNKYLPLLETVKSDGGPTVRLEQFLSLSVKQGAIKEPEGILGRKPQTTTLFS